MPKKQPIKAQEPTIHYRLYSVKEALFHIHRKYDIPEDGLDSGKIAMSFGFSFDLNLVASLVRTNFMVTYYYVEDDSTKSNLLEMEIEVYFEIQDLDKLAQNEKENKFPIPTPLAKIFLGVAIGTLRGMLVYKVAGTYMQPFVLPVLNPDAMIESANPKEGE